MKSWHGRIHLLCQNCGRNGFYWGETVRSETKPRESKFSRPASSGEDEFDFCTGFTERQGKDRFGPVPKIPCTNCHGTGRLDITAPPGSWKRFRQSRGWETSEGKCGLCLLGQVPVVPFDQHPFALAMGYRWCPPTDPHTPRINDDKRDKHPKDYHYYDDLR